MVPPEMEFFYFSTSRRLEPAFLEILSVKLRDMYFLPRMHAPRDESGTKQGKMIIDHWV